MRSSLNKSSGSPSRLRALFARFGIGALLFFTIKGLLWLAIGGGVAAWATR